MSNLAINVRFDALRTLGFIGLSGTYAPIGAALTNPARIVLVQNFTDVSCTFSDDGVNDNFVLPSNGFVLLDVTSNKTETGGAAYFAAGTVFWVKVTSGGASSGAVYVSVVYGYNG